MDRLFLDRLKEFIPIDSSQPEHIQEEYVEIPIATNDEEPRRFKTIMKKGEDTLVVKTDKKEVPTVIQQFSNKYVQNGIIIDPNVPIVRSGAEAEIPRISPMKLELAYVTDGMVHNWINRIVEFFLSARPTIICDNERDQEKINIWAKKVGFRELLKLHFQHKYVYGNAVWRWIFNKNGKRVGLDFIDPKHFDALRDQNGKIKLDSAGRPVGYIQYIRFNQSTEGIPDSKIITQQAPFAYQTGKGILYNPDEIIHFRLNRVGDSWWGIGQIEPVYYFILNKKNADQGYAESLQRIGYPRTVVEVGDKEHPPTAQQIEDVWEEVKGIQEKSQFVVPYYVKFYMLESKKASSLKANLEYFVDNIVSGLGGPKSLITGVGQDTNRATLNDQKLWLERSLKMEQEDTSEDINRRVFVPLAKDLHLKSVPKLVWQEVSMESIESKISRIVDLVKVGVLDPNNKALRNYVIDLEDLPMNQEEI